MIFVLPYIVPSFQMSFLSSIGSFLGGFLMAISIRVAESFAGEEHMELQNKQKQRQTKPVVCPHIVIEVLPEGESLSPLQNQWVLG